MERRTFLRSAAAVAALPPSLSAAAPKLMGVERIWNSAPHNAFTDLVRFRGRWFCAFREGSKHVSPDGALRIIASLDGKSWTSAALIRSRLGDLRDAKLCTTPDGRLMLNGAAALTAGARNRHQSLVWFSHDGSQWSEERATGDPDFWMWRVTWNRGAAYCTAYSTQVNRNERIFRLYKSTDGVRYETVLANLGISSSPGESTLRFRTDGTAICLMRRDPYNGTPRIPESSATALIGIARPPYMHWEWRDTKTRIGGPNFIALTGGRYVAAVRLHTPHTRTVLCWMEPEAGTLREFLMLPSDGDSSYAGLVHHKGILHVSYYSSHEGKTSIYFARVQI
ncbi:MAG: exo-alpha-sialidase [Acidobacteria bacterium]|nr:exo-alpha-sialidase [Acidobacteriota bacterium]